MLQQIHEYIMEKIWLWKFIYVHIWLTQAENYLVRKLQCPDLATRDRNLTEHEMSKL